MNKRIAKCLIVGASLSLISTAIYAKGRITGNCNGWMSGLSTLTGVANTKEDYYDAEDVRKVTVSVYIMSASGKILGKNYNYKLNKTFVDTTKDVSVSASDFPIAISGDHNVYYENGEDVSTTTYKQIKSPYTYVSLEDEVDSIYEVTEEYIEYLEENDISASVDTSKYYSFENLDVSKDWASKYKEFAEINSEVGDYIPYLYLNEEQTFGVLVQKNKDNTFDIEECNQE